MAIIFVVLMVAPDNREGFGFILDFNNGTGWTNNGNGSYIPGLYASLIGLLLAQYTITGFDASAHVSEETTDSGRSASIAIVRAIYVSAIAALILNIAMLQATPKGAFNDIILGRDGFLALGGANALAAPLGGVGAKLLIAICVVAQFFCGMASVTANSRMIYAFSRDGAIPGHRFWHKINPKTRTPTNSIWLGCGAVAARRRPVALPGQRLLGGLLRHDRHVRGRPLHRLRHPDLPAPPQPGLRAGRVEPGQVVEAGRLDLGGLGRLHHHPVLRPAVLAVLAARRQHDVRRGTPDAFTVFHLSNFNFTPVIIISLFIVVGIWWVVSARHWFKGPQIQGTPEELRAIEIALETGDVATFKKLEDEEDARVTEHQEGH